jgi:hypothetical protein
LKRGIVDRHEDVSGQSGTGSVAEFAVAIDGRTVVFWETGHSFFPSLEAAIKTHGHQGKTSFIILDEDHGVNHCIECHEDPKHPSCPNHDFGCPGCLATIGDKE